MKNWLLRILIFGTSLWGAISLFAQEANNCLTLAQLQQLYQSDGYSYAVLLNRNGFFAVSSENNIPIQWQGDTLIVNMSNWQYSRGFNNIYINILSKENYHNYIEYHTSKHCANQIRASIADSIITGNTDENEINLRGDITLYFEDDTLLGNGLSRNEETTISVYNMPEIKQLAESSRHQLHSIDIEKENKKRLILANLSTADSLIESEDYEAAIQILEQSHGLVNEYTTVIDNKLGQVKSKYKQKKIQDYTNQGDELYKMENYADAYRMYSLVLKEDLNNRYAQERIAVINKKIEVLNHRNSMTYSYRESNSENYSTFSKALETEVNTLVNKTDHGKLRFNFSIIFDTLAINQSYYEIFDFETPSTERNLTLFKSRLSNLLGHSSLKPSYKEGIPIKSMSILNVALSWKKYEHIVLKKKNKIVNKSSNYLDPSIEERLLTDSLMPNGKYYFDVKSKSVNAEILRDISLTKYKTVGGEAFFYGIIPGLGTLVATQGKEGTACMVTSLLCYGGATAALILYQNYGKEIKNKQGTMTDEEAKKLNTNREICKWSSLGGFCIGGVIHFSGMIKALVRGIQNKKASKQLRKALREEPIIISTQNINLK